MLSILRKKAQSTVIQGLVLLIAVVFVFWGVGSNLNNNRNSIAVVNGKEIPIQEYQRAYDRAVERYRQQFGGQVPANFFETINLKGQVVGQLVQGELLRQGAEAMGLAVSKEAIQRAVEEMQVFQKDGHFDLERYKQILSRNRLTPTSFEGGLHNDLLAKMVVQNIESFAMVPADEVQQWLRYAGEEIKLAVKAVTGKEFEDKVEIKDAELAAWFEKNKIKYTTEPQIRLKYLFFDSDTLGKGGKISEDELKARYEENKERYQVPEQRHVRHILFKVPKDADAKTVAQKEEQARKVLSMAKAGKDFAELARQYSEGPTAEKGGDLGFFGRGRMVKPFDDAVFGMNKGEIRGPVRTQFGFHIIKVEDIRPATTRGFAEVRDELRRQMEKEEGKAQAFKAASEAFEGIMRAGNLDKYSKEKGIELRKTDFFSRSKPPAGIVSDPAFLEEAFKLSKGELSSLVELGKGYAILFVDDIKPPVVPPLAEVRDRVVRDYTRDRAIVLAKEAAEKELAEAREKGALSGDKLKKTDYLKRRSPAPAGIPAPVVEDAFTLAPAEKFPAKPLKIGDSFYLYQVVERRPGDEKTDEQMKKQLQAQLLAAEKSRLLSDWLRELQQKAEIWTNTKILQ